LFAVASALPPAVAAQVLPPHGLSAAVAAERPPPGVLLQAWRGLWSQQEGVVVPAATPLQPFDLHWRHTTAAAAIWRCDLECNVRQNHNQGCWRVGRLSGGVVQRFPAVAYLRFNLKRTSGVTLERRRQKCVRPPPRGSTTV
jgi:hypothetical protein